MINSYKYLKIDREELYNFLKECTHNGYKCYIYDKNGSVWAYIISGNEIIGVSRYMGGWSYSYVYQPTRSIGSGCACFNDGNLARPRGLSLEILEKAFTGGHNFALYVRAKLYRTEREWLDKYYFKNELVEIKGDEKNV